MAGGRGGAGLFGSVPTSATLDLLAQLVKAIPGGGTNARAVLNGLFGDLLAAGIRSRDPADLPRRLGRRAAA